MFREMNMIFECNTLKKGYGTIEELSEEISREDIEHLYRSGYIRIGISPKGETFSVTREGKEILYLYSNKISVKDRILDFIFKYIIRFNVSI